MITVLDVKYLYGTRNLNCKIHNSTIPGAPQTELNMQKTNFPKILFSTATHVQEKKLNA